MSKYSGILCANAWEIADLSKAQGVDMSVAPDMFCENLATYVPGEPVHYEGADVDYDLLSKIWNDEMTDEDRANAKIQFRHMWADNREILGECRRNGSRSRFDEICFNYTYVDDVPAPDYCLYRGSYKCYRSHLADGITLAQARDNYIAELEAGDSGDALVWQSRNAQQKEDEIAWYDRVIVDYDMGLKYFAQQGNEPAFLSVAKNR